MTDDRRSSRQGAGPLAVAMVQHDIVWQDASATHAALVPRIAATAAAGARLVVLSEMFASGFSMEVAVVAEEPDGPSAKFLESQATAHGIWICGSIAVQDVGDGKVRNRLVLAGPGGELHHYDKIHPFTYAREHEAYVAGDRHLTVEIEGVRTSFFVCYDLRFADEFWTLAEQTDLYVVVANWPDSRRHHWRSLLTARAIENQAYVVGVNRVGDADGQRYRGDSMVVDPLGETVASLASVEGLALTAIDPSTVAAVRHRFPFLQDRR